MLDIQDATGRLSARELDWLCRGVVAAADCLRAHGEVRVRVVDDAAMGAAHERYSGVSGTTDVLTFDLRDGEGPLDTDLLVCLDEASRRGEEGGHEPVRELLLYVVHGMLHCMGHDDVTESGAAAMHEEEDRVLERIGVGATYARVRGGAAGADGEDPGK